MIVIKMKVFFGILSLAAIISPLQAFSLPHPCQGKPKNEIVLGWNSCNVFHICNGEGTGEKGQCLEGYYYDLDKGYCRYNQGNKYPCKPNFPWANINPCKFHDGAQYYPKFDNCSEFIQCDNGKPVVQKCPNGLHYNAKLKVCDWPKNVNCKWWIK